jgi:hypothetical protein
MKKFLFLALMLLNFALAYEETPLLIDTSVINLEIENNNNSLINVENMKKTDSIQKAKDNMAQQKQKLKIDTRQIHHQRTLDYMNNRGSGTMLPIF